MKTKSKFQENERKFYLSEFSYFDGEYDITSNIIDVDFLRQTITVVISRCGKITQDTFDLIRDNAAICISSTASSTKTKYLLTISRRYCKMRNLNLKEEKIITQENILPMSGIIAVKALKTALAYEYSERLLNMYYDLIHDLKCNEEDRPFSDGYDLVMTAACYLCEHIGESLDDINGVSILTKKKITVLKACYGKVQQEIRKMRKAEKTHIPSDSAEALNLSVPFEIPKNEEEHERENDIIDMLIQRMHLTELQLKVLYYCLSNIPQIEIARALGVSDNTVWESLRSIQKRYTYYIYEGHIHYLDRKKVGAL